jgi:hypothetical protein
VTDPLPQPHVFGGRAHSDVGRFTVRAVTLGGGHERTGKHAGAITKPFCSPHLQPRRPPEKWVRRSSVTADLRGYRSSVSTRTHPTWCDAQRVASETGAWLLSTVCYGSFTSRTGVISKEIIS